MLGILRFMYNHDELVKLALAAIEKEECVTIDEMCLFLPCTLKTVYNHKIPELQEIKDAINLQKVRVKKKMRRNWRNSENASLQIAEYKMLATQAEYDRLSTQNKVHTFNNKPSILLDINEQEHD